MFSLVFSRGTSGNINLLLILNKTFAFYFITLDLDEEATFVLTTPGKVKLTRNNYCYWRHSRNPNGSTYWRCEKYKKFKCKAKAFTIPVNGKELVKAHGSHSHHWNSI